MKEEIYDILCNIADDKLKYYNPCKWKDRQCERDRFRNTSQGACCSGCSFLSSNRCTTNNLSCKLWLCSFIASRNLELVVILEVLKTIAYNCGLDSNAVRKSKEEVLKEDK